MATLDDAVAFFTEFFDAEFKVMEANLAGASSFTSRNAKMKKMLAEPHFHAINRQDPAKLKKLTGDSKLANENARKSLAPRQLFWVEEHDLGKKKKFYAAYASAGRLAKKITMFEERFWADSSLQIIGTDFSCADCHGLGTLKGAACNECQGRGWHRKTAADKQLLNKLTKPTAVKRLIRPTWPECAEVYDRL